MSSKQLSEWWTLGLSNLPDDVRAKLPEDPSEELLGLIEAIAKKATLVPHEEIANFTSINWICEKSTEKIHCK